MNLLLDFVQQLIGAYTLVVLFAVVLSWLVGFNVINGYNPTVRMIYQAVSALTEPLLGRIRRILPNLGAIDLSPLVLLLACQFVQTVVIGNLRLMLR